MQKNTSDTLGAHYEKFIAQPGSPRPFWNCQRSYKDRVDGCFQQLAADPLMGKDCSEIREGYRKMSAGSHVIFYRQKHFSILGKYL